MQRYSTSAPIEVVLNTRTVVSSAPLYEVSYMLVQGRTDGVSPSDALTYEVQLDYWIEFSAPVPTYAS
jgi:hypothetical protein